MHNLVIFRIDDEEYPDEDTFVQLEYVNGKLSYDGKIFTTPNDSYYNNLKYNQIVLAESYNDGVTKGSTNCISFTVDTLSENEKVCGLSFDDVCHIVEEVKSLLVENLH